MKTLYIILISIVVGFIIGFGISQFSIKPEITGQAISESLYTYTTAICNNDNKCIDVLIECEGGNVISLTPASDLLDLGSEFQDFRKKEEKFCG